MSIRYFLSLQLVYTKQKVNLLWPNTTRKSDFCDLLWKKYKKELFWMQQNFFPKSKQNMTTL